MVRVGVILDSYRPNAWIAKIIQDIQASDFARIQLVLMDPNSVADPTRLPESRGFSLFGLYEQWDYRRNVLAQDSLKPTDVWPALRRLPTVAFERVKSARMQEIAEDLLIKLRQTDVVLQFTSFALDETILSAPHDGVWSFRHDLDFAQREGKPRTWDALERNSVSETILQVAGDAAKPIRVVDRSYSSLDVTSLYRSRNPIYWKSSEIAIRRLREFADHPSESLGSRELRGEQDKSAEPTYRRPNNLETLGYFLRYAARWFRSHTTRQSGPTHKWCLAVRARSKTQQFDNPAGFQLLASPEDRFYADPFLFERDGRTFLFFEDFRYEEGRAVISCCELDEEGQPGRVSEVLRRPYHLSYPFVFEDHGEIYMLPETRSNRTVELYRATHFPDTWVADSILMNDVQVVDSTLLKADGKYWIFASASDGRYSNCDELSLFYANELHGPWHAHPKNPLLSDVRRARPAGRLFMENGRLIRPSQDCGKAYGYAMVFSEVVKMSESEYEERIVSRLNPESIPHCTATHTYNRSERFEVVDRNLPPAVARDTGKQFPQ